MKYSRQDQPFQFLSFCDVVVFGVLVVSVKSTTDKKIQISFVLLAHSIHRNKIASLSYLFLKSTKIASVFIKCIKMSLQIKLKRQTIKIISNLLTMSLLQSLQYFCGIRRSCCSKIISSACYFIPILNQSFFYKKKT